MKYLSKGRTTLRRFLKRNWSALITLMGFVLLFGAAGRMDYNATMGTSDSITTIVLAVIGTVCVVCGFLVLEGITDGTREGIRSKSKKVYRERGRLAG